MRLVPSVDQLLRTETAQELRATIGPKRVTALSRLITAEIRRLMQSGTSPSIDESAESLLAEATSRLREAALNESRTGIRNVINATGVILHTNLGRAPLSDAAVQAILEAVRYCTLEYDQVSGMRGKRGARVESLLCSLTGAEDALVVNNCAAAALLILGVLARDGETLVSRGELVEIGGDFRVPDVMASSGTQMIEVGTTNRTHLDDYRKALTSRTKLIMRIHPSNYRVVGFASSPDLNELAALAQEAMIPLYEDAGSGQLEDLSSLGIEGEPIISRLVSGGADVISFSGDKLVGSVQAGLIVGKHRIIDRLRRHPLYRALRSDKVRLAALEATLTSHEKDGTSAQVPVLEMLSLTADEIADRVQRVLGQVSQQNQTEFELIEGESAIGGGAGPTARLPTTLIAITHKRHSASELEAMLRNSSPPIISRISEQRVLLDLRTVFPTQDDDLIQALSLL